MIARISLPAFAAMLADVAEILIPLMGLGLTIAMVPDLGTMARWNHRFC